eukprot:1160761-Pelagomonas_calceolata.AAC.6
MHGALVRNMVRAHPPPPFPRLNAGDYDDTPQYADGRLTDDSLLLDSALGLDGNSSPLIPTSMLCTLGFASSLGIQAFKTKEHAQSH